MPQYLRLGTKASWNCPRGVSTRTTLQRVGPLNDTVKGNSMERSKILLVDDNEDLLRMMHQSLENKGFDVVAAANVTQALTQILAQPFDVLITDLHMPQPGDGFAVVTAMHHFQPAALTLVISGFPDVKEAMAAILLQADEVLVKPFDIANLADLIRKRTEGRKPAHVPSKKSVATILEDDAALTIERWLIRSQEVKELSALQVANTERTAYVPEILESIVSRLREERVVEAIARPSPAAVVHGKVRYLQGYTVPLIVQESRILQVCIFETIQRNLSDVDFSLVLPDVMLIADEVDSQLTQSVDSFLKAQQHATSSKQVSRPPD
jgi:DNA-binding response OmpR family regulator